MKIIIIILSALIFSCNNRSEKKQSNKKVPNQNNSTQTTLTSDLNTSNFRFNLIWQIGVGTKKKNTKIIHEHKNIENTINELNRKYPKIKLEKIKISNDTLFTKIDDSMYLCESIGITGAEMYVADVVLNLTELKILRFIKIDFDEGSHIAPGVFSKSNFEAYKEVK